ncbi:MAG: murein L,D-transpeptidase family protein [Desulfovibrionaceae bacterium]
MSAALGWMMVALCVAWCVRLLVRVDPLPAHAKADAVEVRKGARTMTLLRGGRVLARYPVALGRDPVGHKAVEGDGRTPEGRYVIAGRNPRSRFHLALRISYPDAADAARAVALGASPGGDIMIHGQPNGRRAWLPPRRGDWTQGCVAVSNAAIREIWAAVDNGTPVTILP